MPFEILVFLINFADCIYINKFFLAPGDVGKYVG